MSSLIRVGVLDEHEVVRYGLHAHLADQSGIAVVGTYSRAGNALYAIEQGSIDLLLMDYGLQDSHGQRLIKTLINRYPEIRILIFLADPCPAMAASLLAMGVPGGLGPLYQRLDRDPHCRNLRAQPENRKHAKTRGLSQTGAEK